MNDAQEEDLKRKQERIQRMILWFDTFVMCERTQSLPLCNIVTLPVCSPLVYHCKGCLVNSGTQEGNQILLAAFVLTLVKLAWFISSS